MAENLPHGRLEAAALRRRAGELLRAADYVPAPGATAASLAAAAARLSWRARQLAAAAATLELAESLGPTKESRHGHFPRPAAPRGDPPGAGRP